jgi:predicted nuclease of predicted toxin-antitoxin system
MKILVDEDIPRMTVDRLRALGHDVGNIRGAQSQGLQDSDLWNAAMTEQRVLVTTDKGFTDCRLIAHHGILVVRLRQPNRVKIDDAVMSAIGRFRELDWPSLLVLMRDTTMSTSRAGGPVER